MDVDLTNSWIGIMLCGRVEAKIQEQVNIVGELSAVASKHPYYK